MHMLKDLTKMTHNQRVSSLIGLGQKLQSLAGRLEAINVELALLDDSGATWQCEFSQVGVTRTLVPARQHQLKLKVAYIAALKEEHKQVQDAMAKLVNPQTGTG